MCQEIGVRGRHETSPAYFFFSLLALSASPTVLLLLLITSLLLLISLLSCHYSPSIGLLLLALITFCHLLSLSASAVLTFFLPHLLHPSALSFSSPLSPPLHPNSTEVIPFSHPLTVTTVHPASPLQKAQLWWRMPPLSYIICLCFAFRGTQLS